MNTRAQKKAAGAVLVTIVALGGWVAQGLAATSGVVSDFGGGGGRFQMQVRQSGSSFDVDSLSLACSNSSSISATPKIKLGRSGSFSYSGAATMISGAKDKKSKSTLKASGKITFTKPGSLSSAKSGTVKVSTTAKNCKAFSGKLTGFVVPPGS
jgi:hypothetical protein